jgi:GTPase SAR1 family protein
LRQGQVVLIDSPGIDELDGAEREQLARSISRRADVTLMVCEGDLTEFEFQALRELCTEGRTVLVVLNKSDRYTTGELQLLLQRLRERCGALLPAECVLAASAAPRPETVIRVGPGGAESEASRNRPPDTRAERRLWRCWRRKGRRWPLNAALFAAHSTPSGRPHRRRAQIGGRRSSQYCIGKGLLVALNPVPITDLLAAAGSSVAWSFTSARSTGFAWAAAKLPGCC